MSGAGLLRQGQRGGHAADAASLLSPDFPLAVARWGKLGPTPGRLGRLIRRPIASSAAPNHGGTLLAHAAVLRVLTDRFQFSSAEWLQPPRGPNGSRLEPLCWHFQLRLFPSIPCPAIHPIVFKTHRPRPPAPSQVIADSRALPSLDELLHHTKKLAITATGASFSSHDIRRSHSDCDIQRGVTCAGDASC